MDKRKRGRPKKDLTRSNIMSMRFTDAEKDTINELCEMLEMPISETVRYCIREVYEEETRNRKYGKIDNFRLQKIKKIS